jgi:hypothetical protein
LVSPWLTWLIPLEINNRAKEDRINTQLEKETHQFPNPGAESGRSEMIYLRGVDIYGL